MKSSLLFLFSLSLSPSVFAQDMSALPFRTSTEIETSCRAKAKEAAAEVYRGCVSDTKNTQIEQLKREYQVKLLALKAYYEGELKKLNAPKAALPTVNPVEKLNTENPSDPTQEMISQEMKEAVADASGKADTSEIKNTDVIAEPQSENSSNEAITTKPEFKSEKKTDLETETKAVAAPEAKPVVKAPKKVVKKKASANSIPAALAKSPSKKSSSKQKTASKKSSGKNISSYVPTEMTVRLKPAPIAPMRDESEMDLPEPIPVENLSGGSSI